MKQIFLALSLVLLLAACGSKPAETPQLEISDPGKNVEVTAGNEFKIVIESNPSTGYHWELIGNLDERVLQFVSMEFRAEEPAALGSGGSDVWVFRAVAAGETKITLGLYPPGKGQPAEQEVTFTVIVK